MVRYSDFREYPKEPCPLPGTGDPYHPGLTSSGGCNSCRFPGKVASIKLC